jgi:hypothetical protein
MQIESLRKYQRRNRKAYFDDLLPHIRDLAHLRLRRMLDKRRAQGKPVRGWVFGILVGQAKRLALHPPTSEWGRSMLAKRGGYGAQQRYRWEGRNPTAKATKFRLAGARRFSGDSKPEAENLDPTTTYLSGNSTGYTSRNHAGSIVKEIDRRLALDANFGIAVVPKSGWRWELVLTRVPWPTHEP